jgi:rod shape determining protein RodA
LLALYTLIIFWGLRIASSAKDRFGAHVAVGVVAMIFWQVFFNMGMVAGIMPVVGITLPLMSYGGSSALTVLIGIGLLLSVSARRHVF